MKNWKLLKDIVLESRIIIAELRIRDIKIRLYPQAGGKYCLGQVSVALNGTNSIFSWRVCINNDNFKL